MRTRDENKSSLDAPLALAPGFSRVNSRATRENRFNGFLADGREAAEAAMSCSRINTRLKPGANEKAAVSRGELCKCDVRPLRRLQAAGTIGLTVWGNGPSNGARPKIFSRANFLLHE